MSHSYYNKKWLEAQKELGYLLDREVPADQLTPFNKRNDAYEQVATLYIKYVQIFKKLDICYDQIVHPQKRQILRSLLDGVMGRVLELKDEMVNIELTNSTFFDDILSDLKLTPRDMELPIPKYFINERVKALKDRERVLGQILSKLVLQTDDENYIPFTLEEAVKLIQVHERARQGKMRWKFMKELRSQSLKEKQSRLNAISQLDKDTAAVRIQKVWRGMEQRSKTKQLRTEEAIFIGMALPGVPEMVEERKILALKHEEDRRKIQDDYETEYVTALMTIKEQVKDEEGTDMKDNLIDQIRQWFIECRDALGKFPDFPSVEEGGSEKLFKEKDPNEVQKEILEASKNDKKKNKKDKKEKKDKKDKKDSKKDKKKKKDKEDTGFTMTASNFTDEMKDSSDKYNTIWLNKNESCNFMQRYDAELIREEKRMEVEAEIRIQVDELMRQELKNLKLAIDKDKGRKVKKRKSGKKGKKGKKKEKKQKDLTPDRTIESLYEELVMEGIIKRSPIVRMRDYEGEYCYLGSTLRQMNIEMPVSLNDIRRLVTEYAILRMGSQQVHESAPLIKSLMLAGPSGMGKKMLVNAICTETGANLFDLSANNIVGKYPGKEGLKLLLHMVFKVGKALQPSIIYIGDCEKMFKKKLLKTDLSDPKRMKKDLPKALKAIKAEDRLLLVGTTRVPYEGEVKPMCSTYQRIIVIPKPDYASRHLIWQRTIDRLRPKLSQELDISSLAKISDGYTPGMIVGACEAVLSDHRIKVSDVKKIRAVEFVTHLAKADPVYREDEEAYKVWMAKTPLGKKRAKLLVGEEDNGKDKKKSAQGGKKSTKQTPKK